MPATAPASPAARLAEAFATIEELRDHLPVSLYNHIGDGLCSWIGGGSWDNDPDIMRRILPVIFDRLFKEQEGGGGEEAA